MITAFQNLKPGDTITARELMERQQALEEEAEANLAGNWGDENACTYEQGYITQPLYACGTCTAKTGKPFGFCFGCSMNCHVEHDVVELFDKRHFKCDCGTPKSGCTCNFSEEPRVQDNDENKYTHNFQGKYCWCDSTYDPDADIMSQCVVCEDWFHHTCIARRTTIPELQLHKGFLCHFCLVKHPFFLRYPQLQPSSSSSTSSSSSSTTSTTTTTTSTTSSETSTSAKEGKEEKKEEKEEEKKENVTSTTTDNKSTSTANTTNTDNTDNTSNNAKTSTETYNKSNTKMENGQTSSETQQCILELHPAPPTPESFPDLFLIPGWRKGICKCQNCAAMYQEQHVEFLLDDADDPDVDEGEGEGEGEGEREGEGTRGEGGAEGEAVQEGGGKKRKIPSLWDDLDKAEKSFMQDSKIPYNSKLNMVSEFSEMKNEFMEYLKDFAESGKVVTETDVTTFFEEFRSKRARKK